LHPFFGGCEGDKKENYAQGAEQDQSVLKSHGFVAAAEIFRQRQRQTGNNKLADKGADEAILVDPRSFIGIGTHHCGQRRIGQIDRRVRGHQQDVSGAGVENFARLSKMGVVKVRTDRTA